MFSALDPGGGDARQLAEHPLDFLGKAFQAADVDDRVAASQQEHVAVPVDAGEVAGAEPTVFQNGFAWTPRLKVGVENAGAAQVKFVARAHLRLIIRQRAPHRPGFLPRRVQIDQRQADLDDAQALRERHAVARVEGLRRLGTAARRRWKRPAAASATGGRRFGGEERVVERRAVEHRAAVPARGGEDLLGEMRIDDHGRRAVRRYNMIDTAKWCAIGRIHTTRSAGPMRRPRLAAVMRASSVSCEITTPLLVPVVPELKRMNAGFSAASAVRRSRGRRRERHLPEIARRVHDRAHAGFADDAFALGGGEFAGQRHEAFPVRTMAKARMTCATPLGQSSATRVAGEVAIRFAAACVISIRRP